MLLTSKNPWLGKKEIGELKSAKRFLAHGKK